jgi:hypothetical protein
VPFTVLTHLFIGAFWGCFIVPFISARTIPWALYDVDILYNNNIIIYRSVIECINYCHSDYYLFLSCQGQAGAFFRSLYLFSLLKFVGYKHTLLELLFRQPFRAPLLCEKISSNGLLSKKKKIHLLLFENNRFSTPSINQQHTPSLEVVVVVVVVVPFIVSMLSKKQAINQSTTQPIIPTPAHSLAIPIKN